jgi:hypothetical protein
MRNVSDKAVEKIKTLVIVSNFAHENLALSDITWKNPVEPESPQMTI